jgi:threonylcarbamoyladenosine tRNA methylthiotransferase MtaB
MNHTRKKIAFHTLGCKLNFAETSTIARSFPEEEFERVSSSQKADIYIINTCSVTDAADKKCRQAIRKFIKRSPEAFIAVAGCYSQLRPEELAKIPGVDLVLGINERFHIADFTNGFEKERSCRIHSCKLSPSDIFIPSFSVGGRTRSFLKVQDGCDYGCSYCTIPAARGSSRSPSIKSIKEETLILAEKGVKEVVLTGVNTGDFGKRTGGTLTDLLGELVQVGGIERFRISSIEPNLLTDDLIEMMTDNPKILPHFHIPLQSGSNKILGLMRRRYKRELFSDKVRKIKDRSPLAGIGADIITGFPGETEEDFNDTYKFIDDLPLSYLHVFPYSERPGTAAVNLPGKVTYHDKELRSKKLHALADLKHREFMRVNTGEEADVLFEHVKTNGMISGFTGNYIRVEYPWKPYLAGKVTRIRMKGVSGSGRMSAEII